MDFSRETDGTTIDELRTAIALETSDRVSGLHVEYECDRITLSGQSRSFYVKQLATHAVLAKAPKARLENRIRVSA